MGIMKRKEFYEIREVNRGSLHRYYEKFKKLYVSCPQHQISRKLLIQYSYEELNPQYRIMINVISRGVLVDKTPKVARQLISNKAANTQQFGTRIDTPIKLVNEVNSSNFE
jgi:hypothetical protein